MTFQEAIEKLLERKEVQRKAESFSADESGGPWSEWVRMYFDKRGTRIIEEKFLNVERCNKDDKTGEYLRDWENIGLIYLDLKADNWEIVE